MLIANFDSGATKRMLNTAVDEVGLSFVEMPNGLNLGVLFLDSGFKTSPEYENCKFPPKKVEPEKKKKRPSTPPNRRKSRKGAAVLAATAAIGLTAATLF